MTTNQIAYQAHLETVRSNKANERIKSDTLTESIRHNKVTEAESQRHNVASEQETARHNIASETIAADTLAETKRNNEAISQQKYMDYVAAREEKYKDQMLKSAEIISKSGGLLKDVTGIVGSVIGAGTNAITPTVYDPPVGMGNSYKLYSPQPSADQTSKVQDMRDSNATLISTPNEELTLEERSRKNAILKKQKKAGK